VTPTGIGIAHLGWGAFHRAHQAVYTQDAMDASGDARWGILGDVERTPALVPAAREQGGRFTVLTVGVDDDGSAVEQARVIGSVVDVAYPGDETERLTAAMAAPTVHVITLTVTEKGYCRSADGSLDMAQAQADVEALKQALGAAGSSGASDAPAATAIGLLVRGLAARFAAGGEPVTVLSCDNMANNGRVLKAVVDEFIAAACFCTSEERPWCAACEAFPEWLAASTTWPSSMVDRITPAVTPETLDRVEALIGARDEAAVSAEPFLQWVIEDNFAGPRPPWELAGAELVPHEAVTTWEEAKLRMLNGTHSVLAYLGRICEFETMAEAMVDPFVGGWARRYLFEDALPSVTPPAGAYLAAYGESLLHRFANPATGHTTRQVSTDGSQKIPFRWGAAAAAALAAGRVPAGVAMGLAAWTEFVRRAVAGGVDLGDPAAAELLTSTARSADLDNPAAVAAALIALPGILPEGVGTSEELVSTVASNAAALAQTNPGLL
jgi:fructuronate reductase